MTFSFDLMTIILIVIAIIVFVFLLSDFLSLRRFIIENNERFDSKFEHYAKNEEHLDEDEIVQNNEF